MFSIYFGVPGSGKTTHAARVVLKNLRKGIVTFSNVPIKGAFLYDSADLGFYALPAGCDLIIDEAAIDFNNRKFKSLRQETIKFFKLYRHYHVRNIYVYSQSYDDMDITLRRLADALYVVRRSVFPFTHVVRKILFRTGPDKETHEMKDQYLWVPFSRRWFWGPSYWCMFDSWSAPVLPERVWPCCSAPADLSVAGRKRFGRSLGWRPVSGLCKVVVCVAGAVGQRLITFSKNFTRVSKGLLSCFFSLVGGRSGRG